MIYRVIEKYVVTGWTYVEAESEDEAREKLDAGEGDFRPDDSEQQWQYSDWNTLSEATAKVSP